MSHPDNRGRLLPSSGTASGRSSEPPAGWKADSDTAGTEPRAPTEGEEPCTCRTVIVRDIEGPIRYIVVYENWCAATTHTRQSRIFDAS